MDWFLYDNGLRHERVKLKKYCLGRGFVHVDNGNIKGTLMQI